MSAAGKSAVKKIAAEKRVELLFEIGCEEIPADMLPKAEEELKANLSKLLTAENFVEGVAVETFSAPRRLVAWVRGLQAKQADVESEVTGPPKSVAYDAVGAPTRAAQSFAEKQGLALKDIYTIQTPKGEYLAAKNIKRGRTAEQVLNEILPRVIHDLAWPRSMTWTGLDGARFIRPIRWIVGILDGKALKFSYGGVVAGGKTRGHRFLGSSDIAVRDFADYEKKLRSNGVIVRATQRAAKIEAELAAHAKKSGLRIHEDAHLRSMVTYLNEFPSVIAGDFDSAFLALPDEILVTVMRDHQKYFALEKRSGELAPHFLAVINLAKDAKGVVRAGTRTRAARALRRCTILLARRPEMSARRLFAQARQDYLSSRAWEAISTRSNECARSPDGWPKGGSIVASRKLTFSMRIAPRSFLSAISPPIWCASLPNYRASSAACTPGRRASQMK